MSKILKTLIGILLIPAAIGAGKSFYLLISRIDPASNVLHMFEKGVLTYLLLHVLIIRPVYLYVLGHELVHVLATWLCGGKVLSFNVTPSGGNVATSKTNFFIELSPYFVPFYTLLLGPLFMILKTIKLDIPNMPVIFLFLVGLTLTFHFVMTIEALRLKQADIAKSGFIFSIILIFIGNLIVVMAVFSPFFNDISFVSFLKISTDYSREIYQQLGNKALKLARIVGVWQI
ncbi:MAG: hypothetical protein ACE5JK_00345 [Candidatus Omnitrophota bacterium]